MNTRLNLARRPFVGLCVAALIQLAASISAQAQPYPNRPIKLMVAFPPGGSSDFVARTMQPRLEAFFGQTCRDREQAGRRWRHRA